MYACASHLIVFFIGRSRSRGEYDVSRGLGKLRGSDTGGRAGRLHRCFRPPIARRVGRARCCIVHVHTYIHAYIVHTYVYTYIYVKNILNIPKYIHTCIHTVHYIHTYIHTCVHFFHILWYVNLLTYNIHMYLFNRDEESCQSLVCMGGSHFQT
jgi:hypothetical protein